MNLLNITNGLRDWEFQINTLKYIICNSNDYYPMYLCMKQVCDKEKSEYRNENNLKAKISIDSKELDIKHNLFIEISDTYSLNEDKKLTNKSLILKYLELKIQHQDFMETINTIDILLHTLSEEMNDESILKVIFNSIGYKQLIKMLTPYYENEFQKDEFDLSIDEIISFQIQIIHYISLNNTKYDNIIVYARLDYLSEYIIKKLISLTNCKVIIFTNSYNQTIQLENLCLVENDFIDFANIDLFYKVFSQHSFQYYRVEEIKVMIKSYLKENYTHRKKDIYQDLEHFSNQ